MPILSLVRSLAPRRSWLAPLVVAIALTIPSQAAQAVPASLPAGAYCADAEDQAFLGLINDYRAQNGLGTLQLSQTLGGAAQAHASEMATNNYFDHTMLGGGTVGDNLLANGYTDLTYGENIAAGMETAPDALTTWQNSPGHNANMLRSSFNAIGIARAYDPNSTYGWYWTTNFGGTADVPGTLCGAPADSAPLSDPPPVTELAAAPAAVPGETNGAATDDLNLRSGPGASYTALSTVPRGSRLNVTGTAEADYYPVTVGGQSGWVAAAFVTLDSGVAPAAPAALPASSPETVAAPSTVPASDVGITTDVLNLRSGPGSDASVLQTIPSGTTLPLSGEASGGYLGVTYNGTSGWVDAAYLTVSATASQAAVPEPAPETAPANVASPATGATTTSDLNLRADPNAGGAVELVIPAGAPVTMNGDASGGYLGISYNGTSGWGDAAYLAP